MSLRGTLSIEPFRDSFLAAVTAIERAVFRDPWPDSAFVEILSLSDKCWVARMDGHVVGYLVTQWVLDEVHILNVAVARGHQRQGIARAMLHDLFQKAAVGGMCDMFLEVRRSNAGAQSLYRAFGFHSISERKQYYADGEDAVIMQASVTEYPLTADPTEVVS